jgi:hypothetical protein
LLFACCLLAVCLLFACCLLLPEIKALKEQTAAWAEQVNATNKGEGQIVSAMSADISLVRWRRGALFACCAAYCLGVCVDRTVHLAFVWVVF